MSIVFELQKTKDSLKQAFENLFEKYGREFEEDDEIDLFSLEVVKTGKQGIISVQSSRKQKFGYLYKNHKNLKDNGINYLFGFH